jgi:hypothetical protein
MNDLDRSLQSALWRCDIRVAGRGKCFPLGAEMKEQAQAERRTQDKREALERAHASAQRYDASRPCWVRLGWSLGDCWRWLMEPMKEGV